MSDNEKKQPMIYHWTRDPRFIGRKGPDGEDLSADDARSWFPDLDEVRPDSVDVPAGYAVQLSSKDERFWLFDVISSEPGYFFGEIREVPLPTEIIYDPDEPEGTMIGFKGVNVIRVASITVDAPPQSVISQCRMAQEERLTKLYNPESYIAGSGDSEPST